MKKWITVLALTVLAFMTSPTWACQLAGTSLSAEARAEIELSCMRAEKAAAEAAKEMTQTAAVADAKNLSALEVLGIPKKMSEKIADRILKQNPDLQTEELVKQILKMI
jgi:Holliday junction resolvasome RuvABC DNA-binding subunit